jgi:catechol 2,3-dioxygenase-like lactoylglutathione lyase family enzyme
VLKDHAVDVLLLATDMEVAREFYHDKIGLDIIRESPHDITFQCGGDSHLTVTRSATGTADEATQASFRVDDIAAEVAELRARGIKVGEYDRPGLKTHDGVADLGFALGAWFLDPFHNAIGMLQMKAAPEVEEGRSS